MRVHEIENLVTSIDISDSENFIFRFEEIGKTVHFGDGTRINQKILWIIAIFEEEYGVQGEIFLQDSNRPFFREKVIF